MSTLHFELYQSNVILPVEGAGVNNLRPGDYVEGHLMKTREKRAFSAMNVLASFLGIL